MKGTLTNCVTDEVTEVDLDYQINEIDCMVELTVYGSKHIFHLLGGVTGYESFYLKDEYIQNMIEGGWHANVGVKDIYNDLFITADEMKKAFIESGFMVGD